MRQAKNEAIGKHLFDDFNLSFGLLIKTFKKPTHNARKQTRFAPEAEANKITCIELYYAC